MDRDTLVPLVVGAGLTFLAGFAAQLVLGDLAQRWDRRARRADFARQALLELQEAAADFQTATLEARYALRRGPGAAPPPAPTSLERYEGLRRAGARVRLLVARVDDPALTAAWLALSQAVRGVLTPAASAETEAGLSHVLRLSEAVQQRASELLHEAFRR